MQVETVTWHTQHLDANSTVTRIIINTHFLNCLTVTQYNRYEPIE